MNAEERGWGEHVFSRLVKEDALVTRQIETQFGYSVFIIRLELITWPLTST